MTPIAIMKFLGRSNQVFLKNGTYPLTDTAPSSTNYGLTNTGMVQAETETYPWLLAGAASNYEVMATLNSGALQTNAGTGVWLNLGTTRVWGLSNLGTGTRTANVTFQIRPTGGSVQASCTVALSLTTT